MKRRTIRSGVQNQRAVCIARNMLARFTEEEDWKLKSVGLTSLLKLYEFRTPARVSWPCHPLRPGPCPFLSCCAAHGKRPCSLSQWVFLRSVDWARTYHGNAMTFRFLRCRTCHPPGSVFASWKASSHECSKLRLHLLVHVEV